MPTQSDSDARNKKYPADEIEQIEQEFLIRTKRYLAQQIGYRDLTAYCIGIILSQPAVYHINKRIYQLIQEIAVVAESQTIREKLQTLFDT